MFGISMWEVMLILIVALIVLGPQQLTETAKALGKLYRELQKMLWEVRESVDLDAMTSTTPHKPAVTDQVKDQEIAAPLPAPQTFPESSTDKTGPDFYGALLAESRRNPPAPEPDKPTGPEQPASAAKKDAPEVKKTDGSPEKA